MKMIKKLVKNGIFCSLVVIMVFGSVACQSATGINANDNQNVKSCCKMSAPDKGYLDETGQWIETKEQKDRRMEWWREARFGMFIHWGLYSVTAGQWKDKWQKNKYSEWIMIHFHIPAEEYRQLANQFNPTEFDAEHWVKLAKDAGMKYIVITAKHHDGFAMYHSKASEYNIVDATPFKRDPMTELAKACKKYGLRLCFYYSQSQDWNEPDGLTNYWDFPDDIEDKTVKGGKRNWVRTTFPNYMKRKAIPQVKELLTNYGPVGLIWYDTPRTINKDQAMEFINVVREIQPDCIVNSRIYRGNLGDYGSTGDNSIPGSGKVGDWEMPGTINDTWGFRSDDHNWKSSKTLIHNLINIASMGGNYLLNIGPKASGEIPVETTERLAAMGNWMKVNSESIYGTSNSPFKKSQIKWGRCTAKDDRLYFHVFDWPKDGKLTVPEIKNKITKTYLLANGKKLNVKKAEDGKITIEVPQKALDDVATVIVMEFKGKLDI